MSVFIIFAIVPAMGLVATYALWIGYPIAIPAVCVLLLAALLQLFVLRSIRCHTASLQPRPPGEMCTLALSFLLLIFLVLQLCLTPIIGGSANCDCAWDRYSRAVVAIQIIGATCSVFSGWIGLMVAFEAFLSNQERFSVRSC